LNFFFDLYILTKAKYILSKALYQLTVSDLAFISIRVI